MANPLNELEAQEDEVDTNAYSSLSLPKNRAYMPHGSIVPYENPKPEGSTFMANIRQEVTWGGLANQNKEKFDINKADDFNFLQYVPDHLMQYAPLYATAMNTEDMESITQELDQKLKDEALFRAYPLRSLASGAAAQFIDPVNWLPMGAAYRGLKGIGTVAKSIVSTSASAMLSTATQEAILQQRQLGREFERSVANVATAGVLGGVFGTFGGIWGKYKDYHALKTKAGQEITNVMTDTPSAKGFEPPKGQGLYDIPEALQPGMKITPMGRLQTSPFDTSKFVGNTLFEHVLELDIHSTGKSMGPSVEEMINLERSWYGSKMADVESIYYSLIGIDKGPAKDIRSIMNTTEWNKVKANRAIYDVLVTNVPHENPKINQMADIYREVFERGKKGLIEVGELSPDVQVKNANGYGMIVYDTDKIIAEGGAGTRAPGTFNRALFDAFTRAEEKADVFRKSPAYKSLEAERKQLSSELTKTEQALASAKGKKNTSKIKQAKDKIKKIKEGLEGLKAKLANMVEPDMINSKGELRKITSEEMRWASATSTTETIINVSDGKMANPFLGQLKTYGGGKPTKERTLMVAQTELMDWHITNPDTTTRMYVNAVAPTIALGRMAQKYGAKDFPEFIGMIEKNLNSEYAELSKGLTGKKALELKNTLDANKKDILDSFELMKGTYGAGPNNNVGKLATVARNFRRFNDLRMLGGVVLSSIGDIGAVLMKNGVFNTVFKGLVPLAKSFGKINKEDLKACFLAMEGELGIRISAFTETQKALGKTPGMFSRGLDFLAEKFGDISLMNQWNNSMNRLVGTVSINRTINSIKKIVEGKKISAKDKRRLASLGIDESSYRAIYDNTINNLDKQTGAYYVNWDNWDIKDNTVAKAMNEFMFAIRKDVNSTVIIPGKGDKPLFYQTELGKVMGQYKSFAFGATNRILWPAVQSRKELQTYTGLMAMLSFGALSYIASSYSRGKEPDLDFDTLAWEAIDRSGLLGIFAEAGNIAYKTVSTEGLSRYQSRTVGGALAGPTIGTIDEVARLIPKVVGTQTGSYRMTTRDAVKFLRLVPFQNLFYLRQLNEKFAKDVAIKMGARRRG